MEVLNEIARALPASDKPIIKQIYNQEGQKMLAIGLKKGVVFPEHLAPSKAKLMVIQGEVDYNTETESFRFQSFDTYDIPMNVKHSVVGFSNSIFLVLFGKPEAKN
ncbi:hypothetical protein EAX61_01540 [Dokdonia sinensis]|uniref:Cupin domain-containing protein n=2 Tax=Dokdonia sinensis TaxID=2479847 RepID=A0A3M0GR68_9FLAO|nr:hypothetical protein EAX61_01540 [Dokdonia sinensis]